jgi:hypothetical protein
MVKRQETMRPRVPRPGDSRTQPTNAFAVGVGLRLGSEEEVGSITAAYLLSNFIKNLWQNNGYR